jgi:trk system potassium uptake protein TrkH
VLLFPRTPHARVSALTSLALIVLGALVFYAFGRAVPGNTFVLSVFQSIAARTAGFGWIDLGRLPDLAALWLMALMFVGACPGGTAGGVKLTVFYVMGRAFGATGRGLTADSVEGRESAAESMEAFAIVGLFGATSLAGAILVGLVEDLPGLAILFEVVSAVSTTGLSMNLTPQLSSVSLVALVPLMLIGKVGPVLLLQAIFRGRPQAQDFLERLQSGRVLIG